MSKHRVLLLLAACCLHAQLIVKQPPAGMTPAKNLTGNDRRQNFDALWSAIDTTYADFRLKSIDWADVGRRYRQRLDSITTGDDFYRLLFQFVNELKDTHSWLQNYRVPPPEDGGTLAVDLFEGKPFVLAVRPDSDAARAGVAPGWEVVSVDGRTVAEQMEALRPRLHACSTERAYQRQAARVIVAGETGSTAIVQLKAPDGRVQTVSWQRNPAPRLRPRGPRIPVELTRGSFVWYGVHSSGLGYIFIDSFNGREEIVDEFDRALEALRNTPGLILDIRDNTGGFGQPKIEGRLLSKRSPACVAFVKTGPGHNSLDRQESIVRPVGPWQYKNDIALLVNDVTGSAADLFACDLRSARRVKIVGTTTHGNLSGVAAYAVLPCGLVVRVSNGYMSDTKNRPIEGKGNVPDVTVETTVADYLAGRDPVLAKAVELLLPRR
jgi:carboxyl-terminal processing protease